MSNTQENSPSLIRLLMRQEQGRIDDLKTTLFKERLNTAKSLYRTDLLSHYGCVNAIEFSKDGKYLISGGDDRNILLWKFDNAVLSNEAPTALRVTHQSNIFCLGFDNSASLVYSGGNDDMVFVQDIQSQCIVDSYCHQKPIYGLSVNPTNNFIFATACEEGKCYLYDLRRRDEELCFAKYQAPFHAVQFHPLNNQLIVTANADDGAALWDIRSPGIALMKYKNKMGVRNGCMSVCFDTLGTKILALRRRLPPILYNTTDETHVAQFYHSGYYNTCTMKSCCFAGPNDEYILSGSDDFNLYMWKIADVDMTENNQWVDRNYMVLYGHRSIVNQVRYNPHSCIIASSGVEKMVKLWSPFYMENWQGDLQDDVAGSNGQREIYTQDQYRLMLQDMNYSLVNSLSPAQDDTSEDTRMLAFFDCLVQRDIENWDVTDSASHTSCVHSSHNESDELYSSTTESATSDSSDDDSDGNGGKSNRRKHPNRIAILIASKRNALKRLALKGSPISPKRQQKSVYSRLKLRMIRAAMKRSRLGRLSNVGRHKAKNYIVMRRTRERLNLVRSKSNHKSVPTRKDKKDKTRQSQKRRIRLYKDKNQSESSDDNDDNSKIDDIDSNPSAVRQHEERSRFFAIPSTSTGITASNRNKNIRTRRVGESDSSDIDNCHALKTQRSQNINESYVKPATNGNDNNANNRYIAIPSTSTGITANRNQHPFTVNNSSSDEGPDISSTLPSKTKGVKLLYTTSTNNSSEYDENEEDHHEIRKVQNRRKRYHSNSIKHNPVRNNMTEENCLGSSKCTLISVKRNAVSSDDDSEYFHHPKRRISNEHFMELSQPIIDNQPDIRTPQHSTRANMHNCTPDSGIPSSSGFGTNGSSTMEGISKGYNEISPAPSSSHLFNGVIDQKVERVRRNYSKSFGDETESD